MGGKLSGEEEEEGERKGEAVLAGVGEIHDWLDCLGLTVLTVDFYYFFPPHQLQNHDRQLLNIKLMGEYFIRSGCLNN